MPPEAWPTCPACAAAHAEVLHRSNPEASTTDATLECQDCGHVFQDVLHEPEDVTVKAVVSEGEESESTTLELPPDEPVEVGDEVYGEGHRLFVTALDLDGGDRVDSADPEDLGTVWCKVFDTVTVPISVNQGHKTWTGELNVKPEDVFYVGDRLTLKEHEVEVHAIKTDEDVWHDGSYEARDIVRLYARATEGEPIRFEEVHRTEIFRSRAPGEEGSS
jgi:uncharacterized Zn finger protein